MPIDIVYTQNTELDWSQKVTCPHCGHDSLARVRAQGSGEGTATLGIGMDGAKERAGIGAFTAATDAAREAIALARCPKCHKRGEGFGWLVGKSVFGWLFAIGLAVWFMVARFTPDAAGLGFGCVAFCVAILAPLTIFFRLRAADAAVWFDSMVDLAPAHQKRSYVPVHMRMDAPEEPAATPSGPSHAELIDQQFGGGSSPADAPADDGDSLELDTDRSWRKKP